METKTLNLVSVFQLLLFASSIIRFSRGDTCTFVNDNRDQDENAAFQKLKPLVGKRYHFADPYDIKYSYTVGICASALPDQAGESKVGAVQFEKDPNSADPKSRTVYKLGALDTAKIIAGSDWIFLEYGGGGTYGHHCSHEARRAIIMISCDESVSDVNAKMELLEENKNMSAGCYYLFELSHKAICPGTKPGNLSLGSIFIIVLISVIAVYLFFGFLYQRFVLGAKGMEQIPNYGFWQDFGNLQADGCNFVCRSGENRGPRTYKGVGDDQLDDVTETDDHLLPM